uniref:putative disease resistance RPP13-like protein 1 n=1 Tax=Erigeron canadensis TaxID=72917 RepID=UPI001CB9D441|nr:putative disease resistance RPP13-like protein 1 [Erigeron canadensis]
MSELLVSALISVLFEKLDSESLMSKFLPLLGELKTKLTAIQAVILDAAEKQLTANIAVKRWLNKLTHLSYDIEDILNDLIAESMRRRLKKNATSTTKKVLKPIPTYVGNTMYDRKMVSKLHLITLELQHLYEESNELGVSLIDKIIPNRMNRSSDQETSCVAYESEIFGREGDKQVLLPMLLGNNDQNYVKVVIAIVGKGGIGKTTMAKVLFTDDQVKGYFEPMAWIHVGNEPKNMLDMYQTLFQSLDGSTNEPNFHDLNLLLPALNEKLTAKRFLLVFDDVWNVDSYMWKNLLQHLCDVGLPGSKVIVTTRITEITYEVPSVEVYPLKGLSCESAHCLFHREALRTPSLNSDRAYKYYVERIVKKCDGSPLALRTLGRLLCTNLRDKHWEFSNSEIEDLINDFDQIILRTSYQDLSAPMKRMFAYFSFFPRGYVFDKAELVLLWMAEGFLCESDGGSKSMESLGDEYFEHLKSRAFFQHSANEETQYTMPDPIHELAISIAQDYFFLLDDGKKDSNGASMNFHHFSFIRQRFEVKLGLLQNPRRLRTFLAMPVRVEVDEGQRFCLSDKVLRRLLPKLQSLRVLSLTGYPITKIPNSIGSLKHIKYINFSQTDIRRLPEQVCELYELQSLLLCGCRNLHSLPKSFVKLKNLRHLDLSDTPSLNKLPSGIGGLTNLQTLPKVIIDEANGFKISNLQFLKHLRGRLSIEGLHNVKEANQAREAKLEQKNGLDDLVLEWSENPLKEMPHPSLDVAVEPPRERTEHDILEMLQPHSGLKTLEILYYGGMEFPRWVGDQSFNQLTQLTLHGCKRCHCLPTLGHLKSLKKLFVESMNKVDTLDNYDFLGSNNDPFASLEVLGFKNMRGWHSWTFRYTEASLPPRLRELSIINCPNLIVQPYRSIPSLPFLHIERCYYVTLRNIVRMCPPIVRLRIDSVSRLSKLETPVLELGTLQYLCITKCHDLRCVWGSESATCNILVNLQKLEVRSCKNLESLGAEDVNSEIIQLESVTDVTLCNCERLQSFNCPKRLERLVINNCRSITSLSFPAVPALGLKILDIQRCSSLEVNWLYKWSQRTVFPVACFVHMTKLIIMGCDNIEYISEEGFGILQSLRYLELISCKSMKYFPHMYLQRLESLVELSVTNCPHMDKYFPCGFWPPNLESLRIGRLKKPMSQWGIQDFPPSLVNLCLLGENSGVVSFAKENDTRDEIINSSSFLLPSSLTFLKIIGFRRLGSLSEGLDHLKSLKQLPETARKVS